MEFEEKYFMEVYRNYEKQNPDRKINSYLREILRKKREGNLLDIGCAYGTFLEKAKKYFSVRGIDVSRHAISTAKKKKFDVKVSIAEKTGFSKGKFDVITMFDVVEHVNDLDSLFKEIRRILKTEGVFVLSVPVYDGFAGAIVRMMDRDITHLHKKSRRFWINTLKKEGFSILSFKGIFRYFFLKRFYLHFISKALRRCSPAIFIIAKKN
jgi:2-polyprenyl-3-methyl-5-hydroxy-6-metoxy-1,4-benzoquinol methylase